MDSNENQSALLSGNKINPSDLISSTDSNPTITGNINASAYERTSKDDEEGAQSEQDSVLISTIKKEASYADLCAQIRVSEADIYSVSVFNRYGFLRESNLPDQTKESLKEVGLCKRTFGKVGKGSIRASIFTLMAVAVGVGTLSLPNVLAICGFGMGLMMFAIGALLALWGLYLMIDTAERVGARNFMVIVERSAGRSMAIFVEWTILICCFGMLIMYQVFDVSLLRSFLIDLGYGDSIFVKDGSFNYLSIIEVIGSGVLVLFPLSIQRETNSLRYASLLSIAAIAYIVLVIVIEFPFYFNKYHKEKKITWFDFNTQFFNSFAIIFYSFMSQQGLFPVYGELQAPIIRRIRKVVNRSILADLIIYLLIGVAGYLSTFNDTPDIICNRPSLNGNFDIPINIGRILIFLGFMINYAVMYNVFRRSVFNLIWSPKEKIANPKNLMVTIITLSVTMIITIVFPKVKSIFSIIGGFCSAMLCFFFPTLCYLKTINLPKYHINRIINVVICIIFTFIGLISVGFTIANIIQGKAT